MILGAAGDGVADDTLAWQDAINNAPTGGIVDGGGKTYLVGSLNLKSDLTVQRTTFRTKPGVVDFVSPITIGAYGDTATRGNIRLWRVHVHGNRAGHSKIGATEDGGRHGFRLVGPIQNLVMDTCSATMCASDGLCIFGGSGFDAIRSTSTGIMSNLRFTDCSFTSNRRHGVSLDSATDVTFDHCTFDNNGRDTGPSEGAQGARLGGLVYGNGVDVEEYGATSYAGNLHFGRCHAVGNAREGVLVFAGPLAADAPGYTRRTGFTFERSLFDAGTDPSGSSFGLLLTPPGASKANIYYDGVLVRDCEVRGGVGLRSVATARIDGQTVLTSVNPYSAMADHCGTVTVAPSVQRSGKAVYIDTSTVVFE